MISVGRMFMSVSDITLQNDFADLSRTIVDIYQQLTADGLDTSRGSSDLFVPTGGREIVRFVWDGIDWTAKIFFERLTWLGAAVAIVLAAAIPFDRFDPARRRIRWQRKRKRLRPGLRVWQKLLGAVGLSKSVTNDAVTSSITNVAIDLTQLHEKCPHRRFWAILLAEVRLMIKGQKWWWYTVALGLIIASLFSPLDVVRRYLFPAAWLWPILLWSALCNLKRRKIEALDTADSEHNIVRGGQVWRNNRLQNLTNNGPSKSSPK